MNTDSLFLTIGPCGLNEDCGFLRPRFQVFGYFTNFPTPTVLSHNPIRLFRQREKIYLLLLHENSRVEIRIAKLL